MTDGQTYKVIPKWRFASLAPQHDFDNLIPKIQNTIMNTVCIVGSLEVVVRIDGCIGGVKISVKYNII